MATSSASKTNGKTTGRKGPRRYNPETAAAFKFPADSKAIRLTITGARDDIPRALMADGNVGNLKVLYLMLPHTQESIIVIHTLRGAAADREFWMKINQPGGHDLPRIPSRKVSAAEAGAAWAKIEKRVPADPTAKAAYQGEWTGQIVYSPSKGISLEILRRMKGYANLLMRSEMAGNWEYRVWTPQGRNWFAGPGGVRQSGFAAFARCWTSAWEQLVSMIKNACVIEHMQRRPDTSLKTPKAKAKAAEKAEKRAKRTEKKAKKVTKGAAKIAASAAPTGVAKAVGGWYEIKGGKHKGFQGKAVSVFKRNKKWRVTLQFRNTTHSATLSGLRKLTDKQAAKRRNEQSKLARKASAAPKAKKPAAAKKAAEKKPATAKKKPAKKAAAAPKAKKPATLPASVLAWKGKYVRVREDVPIRGGFIGKVIQVSEGNEGGHVKVKGKNSGPKLKVQYGSKDITIHLYDKAGKITLDDMGGKSKAHAAIATRDAKRAKAAEKRAAEFKKLKAKKPAKKKTAKTKAKATPKAALPPCKPTETKKKKSAAKPAKKAAAKPAKKAAAKPANGNGAKKKNGNGGEAAKVAAAIQAKLGQMKARGEGLANRFGA